jgi:hypothetical protein
LRSRSPPRPILNLSYQIETLSTKIDTNATQTKQQMEADATQMKQQIEVMNRELKWKLTVALLMAAATLLRDVLPLTAFWQVLVNLFPKR